MKSKKSMGMKSGMMSKEPHMPMSKMPKEKGMKSMKGMKGKRKR